MSEYIFNDFNSFFDFLNTHRQQFESTKINSFMGIVTTLRTTKCGMCKRKNFSLAEDTYRNMFTLLTQEDKNKIKSLLNVENVKFYFNGAPMFSF